MIDYSAADGVARITFNTPQTHNHFTYQLMLDYIAALDAARASGARVLVIAAEGEHFTLGRDQKEVRPDVPRRQNLGLILKANAALRAFPGVSIALVNGRAMGFGSGVSLHTTISLAADDAIFGFDEIGHGLAPLIVQVYLPYFIAPRTALELVATGRDVSAEEAARIGLVSRVVPKAQLKAEGEALVEKLRANSAAALSLITAFGREVNGYPDPALGEAAADRLAEWIAAGKPVLAGA
ncbi:enoyl-CoA hydratase/isomerase family protein [Xanthobacter sp. V4C-4]|uniref:enoyl-CoA hydratase/isomerase family protein n=1 Tax=Xanthobacter cornucopiae TaxID=3119924 RepID=UPI003729061F